MNYIDATNIIQPDTRTPAERWLDTELERRGAGEQGAEPGVPWPHWNDRCYRTLKAMRPDVKMERTGTHHNAVDDATSQARHALALLAANA